MLLVDIEDCLQWIWSAESQYYNEYVKGINSVVPQPWKGAVVFI